MSTTAQQEVTAPATSRPQAISSGMNLERRTPRQPTDFYTHVVGWKAMGSGDPSGIPYTLFSVGGLNTAGLMDLTPEMEAGGMKPAWVGFIGVDDVDAYAKRVEEARRQTALRADGYPDFGRFASAEDPQGAVFLFSRVIGVCAAASSDRHARHCRME